MKKFRDILIILICLQILISSTAMLVFGLFVSLGITWPSPTALGDTGLKETSLMAVVGWIFAFICMVVMILAGLYLLGKAIENGFKHKPEEELWSYDENDFEELEPGGER